jgi:hypothetical protein
MAANEITSDGMRVIGKALQSNTHITYLELSGNKVGDIGAAAVAEVLKVNAKITLVGLHMNSITDAGAVKLAAALTTNQGLEYLGLNKNAIGDKGASALAAATRLLTSSVATLKLDNNRVGDAGALALADAVAGSWSLRTLKLAGNPFGASGSAALNQARRWNPVAEVVLGEPQHPEGQTQTAQIPLLDAAAVSQLTAFLSTQPAEFAFVKFDTLHCGPCAALDPFWAQLAGMLPGHLFQVSCEVESELCRDRGVEIGSGEPVFEAWGSNGADRFSGARGTEELLQWLKQKVDDAQVRGKGGDPEAGKQKPRRKRKKEL